MHGRWVYDAGHSGWNEIPPVITPISKISNDNIIGKFDDHIKNGVI